MEFFPDKNRLNSTTCFWQIWYSSFNVCRVVQRTGSCTIFHFSVILCDAVVSGWILVLQSLYSGDAFDFWRQCREISNIQIFPFSYSHPFSLSQRQKNLQSLREMIVPPRAIKVYRQKKWVSIQSYELVPGDIISLSRSSTCPADVVLISGTCVVNEAMLTGESTPKMKVSFHSNYMNEWNQMIL